MILLSYYLHLTISQVAWQITFLEEIMIYTIGEAAVKMGLTPYTLRYYDREGLLPFVERSVNGVRLFGEKDFEWIQMIECLKKSGMPIKKIKTFIDWYVEGNPTIEKRRDMFYERKAYVEEQIEMLKETLDMLKYKCWFYDTALAEGSTCAPKNIKHEDLPKEIQKIKRKIKL